MTKRTALSLLLMLALVVTTGAQAPAAAQATDNPLLKEWTTPFKVPPYPEIKPEHFLPAIKEGIVQYPEGGRRRRE